MSSIAPLRAARLWLTRLAPALAAMAALVVGACGSAWAQDDPPGRVGRLADMRGQVWLYDLEDGQWTEAERNRPLTQGDRISTAPGAGAELRIGSTVLRLGAVAELEVLQLDDERMAFQLHTGSLALRVVSREVAEEIELVTGEVRLRPLRSGHYRLDRVDDATHAGSWRGSLRIADPRGFDIETSQRVELWRETAARTLRYAWRALPDDDFGAWATAEDQREQRSASSRYVSPEMTGAEDLDRYGQWNTHPEYGSVWVPYEVRSGWAPYRYGRWVRLRPWGWTWIDEAPWGFAPFHYGRWVHWGGRWGWWPGAYVTRPIFAPAVVGWVGGSNWGVSFNIGGPPIGWVPLAPYESYVPWYRHTPVYIDRINRRPPGHPGRVPVPRQPTGPGVFGNQAVPGAVTVVPRDVLVRRLPVGQAANGPRSDVASDRSLVRVEPPSAPVAAPRAGGPVPGQRPPPSQQQLNRREARDDGHGDSRSNSRERREPRQAGEVRAPNELTIVPPPGRATAPVPGSVATRPPERGIAEPGAERGRERPAPATAPPPDQRMGPQRPAQPIVPAAKAPPAPPAAPAAPAPQPPPAATPPPAPVPVPAPAVQPPPAETAPARGEGRQRVPESRPNSREQQR